MKTARLQILVVIGAAFLWGTHVVTPALVRDNTDGAQRPALILPLKNPHIVVTKSARRLDLYSEGAVVRSYKIGLGLSPVEQGATG